MVAEWSPASTLATGPTPVPASRVDFHRQLVCILGLPFDAIGLAEAVERIRAAAFAGRRCFVSTPNLNFAVTALGDPTFRDSVLRSDLSLVDGMPLVWIARLLGLPVKQRVSGADVFEALRAHRGAPIDVFVFGGPPGAAAQAHERINAQAGGVRCVGFESPGFGSIESMSATDCIDRINRSGAHFVVVALGAQKGQAWIEHNAAWLTAPVLCHLGAVVNFAAGKVARAPVWMQRSGLEWLWRIIEEPGLWRRYAGDGLRVARLLVTRVTPDALTLWPRRTQTPARLDVHHDAAGTRLVMNGTWMARDVGQLRDALASRADGVDGVSIDLAGVDDIDNGIVGTLLVAMAWFAPRGGFELIGASGRVARKLKLCSAGHLLSHRHASVVGTAGRTPQESDLK